MRTRGIAMTVMTLAMVFGGRIFADAISDTITINIKGISPGAANPDTITMTLPEVVVDGKESGESKLVIDLSNASGFIGNNGYILFCEPPMNPLGGCGPKNNFKGVSDILAKGVQSGNGNKPAYFFFSDPFSANAPNDATPILLSLFNLTDPKKIPTPLSPTVGVLETGQAQEVAKLFGFTNSNAIIVTSDLDTPEPSGFRLLILAAAFLALLSYRRRRRAWSGRLR